MSVIAELIRAGVDPELIARVVDEMIEAARSSAPVKSARQERNARYYQSRKERLKPSETTETVLIKTDKTQDDASRADNITTRAPALIPVGLSIDNPPINSPLVVPPNPETAPRRASRASPRTRIGEDQLPERRDVDHAVAAGMTHPELVAEWRRFRDHHRAKGSTMADWSAAWRTWVGNRERFAQPRAGPARREETSGVAKLLAEAYGFDKRNGTETAGDMADFRSIPVIDDGYRIENHGDDGGLSRRLPRPDG